MKRDLQVLTFTSLYPSAARPRHGIFVEARLLKLLARGGMQASVIAPVPWFPFRGSRWGDFGRIAETPVRESRHGVDVRYPRYPSLPRIGFGAKPWLMAMAGWRAAQSLVREGHRFDLVDAHYLYPDGVAAASIAGRLGIPFLLSARGTDVNVIAKMAGPMRRIRAAIDASAGVIVVSEGLKSTLVSLGVQPGRIHVLRNGVDAEFFRPVDRRVARERLGLPPVNIQLALFVGNLVAEKRPVLALEAAVRIHGLQVAFVGRGPERARIEERARELGVRDRVRVFDEVPQQDLPAFYSAADLLVLSSEREGWPNVVLEAAACGTPVAAVRVGGIPEILADPALGTMARDGDPVAGLAEAIQALLARPRAVDEVRAAAQRFAWEPVLDAQSALFRRAAGASPAQSSSIAQASVMP